MSGINKFVDAFDDKLNEVGISFNVDHKDDRSIFRISMPSDNCPGFNLRVAVEHDGCAKIWCYLASSVKDSKRNSMLEALNSLNDDYRFVRFSIDSDDDVAADYDFFLPEDPQEAAEMILRVFMLVVRVLDKSVSSIMSIVWSKD